jgi:hypothetical protein
VRSIALKKTFCLAFLLMCGFVVVGQAQFNIAFGVGTTQGTPGSDVSLSDIAAGKHQPVNIGGGAYPAFSADYLFKHHFGVGGQVAWRASQNNYPSVFGFQPFRPIFWDFNAVYAPTLGLDRKVAPEFQGGIGAQTVRYYTPYYNCNFAGCVPYQSINHFMTHLGVGLKIYAHGNFFIRPEAHFYFVNNNQEFSSPYVRRYGVSIGYTLGER